MRIAFVGDVHGELRRMYSVLSELEVLTRNTIDEVVQLGDFHAIRDAEDLKRFPCKDKYRRLGDFHRYLEKGSVPMHTYFIGGNHENFYWLNRDFPGGGQILNKLVYLGNYGIARIGDINLGWISGNYSPTCFEDGNSRKKRPKHFNRKELEELVKLHNEQGIDILVMHDWPSIKELNNHISGISEDMKESLDYSLRKEFGCNPLFELVNQIRPRYVFAGHTHVFLTAKLDFNESLFVSLNKVGEGYSTAILDTDKNECYFYNDAARDEFGILKEKEQRIIRAAFLDLENENLNPALAVFDGVIANCAFSDQAKSFAHYGIGVVLMKLIEQNNDAAALDKAIEHLRASLNSCVHESAVMVLEEALKRKISISV